MWVYSILPFYFSQDQLRSVEDVHASAVAALPPPGGGARLVRHVLGPRRVLLLPHLHLPDGRGGHPRVPNKLSGSSAQGEEARARPPRDADGPTRRHSGTAPGLIRVPLAGLHHGPGRQPLRGGHLLPLPKGDPQIKACLCIVNLTCFLLTILKVPLNYPFDPPEVRFLTRIFHPNVSRHGDVGIDSILKHNWVSGESTRTGLCYESYDTALWRKLQLAF